MRTALLVCALTGAMFAASNAQAATATGNLSVTANVAAACAVTASTAVAFGPYDPLAPGALNGQGTVTVRCTKGSSYDLALGTGSNSVTPLQCVTPARRMTNGTDFLPYQLYQTSARTTIWGSGAKRCGSTRTFQGMGRTELTMLFRPMAPSDA